MTGWSSTISTLFMGKSSFAVRIFRARTIAQSLPTWHKRVPSHSQRKTFPTTNKDYSYKKTHLRTISMTQLFFRPLHRREKYYALKPLRTRFQSKLLIECRQNIAVQWIPMAHPRSALGRWPIVKNNIKTIQSTLTINVWNKILLPNWFSLI